MKFVTVIQAIGVIFIFVGLISALLGDFLVPIMFPSIINFLSYPSAITVFLSGVLLLFCPDLLAKSNLKNHDLEISTYTILFLLAAVFGWEAIYHYAFPVYLNYFKPPYIDLQASNVYLLAVVLTIVVLAVARIKKRISFNIYALACLVSFLVLMAFWILCGFPQYFELGVSYYPIIINIGLENSATGVIMVNFMAKTLFTLFFVSACLNENSQKEDKLPVFTPSHRAVKIKDDKRKQIYRKNK